MSEDATARNHVAGGWTRLKTGINSKIGKYKPLIKLFSGYLPNCSRASPQLFLFARYRNHRHILQCLKSFTRRIGVALGCLIDNNQRNKKIKFATRRISPCLRCRLTRCVNKIIRPPRGQVADHARFDINFFLRFRHTILPN